MFLRPHQRSKDGKDHTYWSLVDTVRTVGGPRQRMLCYLGELNGSAQARWLKSVEVFNEYPRYLRIILRNFGRWGDSIRRPNRPV
jgi:hypothetical protein